MGRFAVTHLCRSADFKLLEDADRPAIAQLVEHLTVDCCSNQMVPGSIPGGRIWCQRNQSVLQIGW